MLELMLAVEEAAHAGEPAINPWVVGGASLTFFMVLLAITMLFGLGREHS